MIGWLVTGWKTTPEGMRMPDFKGLSGFGYAVAVERPLACIVKCVGTRATLADLEATFGEAFLCRETSRAGGGSEPPADLRDRIKARIANLSDTWQPSNYQISER